MGISVRAKMLFISVAILFIAIGTNTLFDSLLFSKEYSKAIQDRTFLVGETMKSQLEGLLESGTPIDNIVGFEEQCQQLVNKYRDIFYAMVVDLNGKILFHNAQSQHHQVLSDSGVLRGIRSQKNVMQVYSREGEAFYDFTIPVFGLDGAHIAAVKIGLSSKRISQKTGSIITRYVGVALVFFGLGIILLILCLHVWITKPFGKLVTQIQGIGQQGTDTAPLIEIESKDELGQLASAFNQMISEIRESDEKIRNYTRNLEIKAQESPPELEASHERLKQYIVERKRMEEALWESERKSRTILENIEDAYYESDLSGNFTFFNDSLCGILGYSRDELIGMNDREYTDKETAKSIYQTFSRIYATGKPAKGFDWEIVRKDGTRRYVEASGSLIKDREDRPIGFRGIIRDITPRKRMENVLRESERKYRTILENIEDAYYETDLAGNFTFFNDSLCRILGYRRDELIGMNNREYTDKETAKRVYQAFNKVYTMGKAAQAIHLEIIRKDGTRRHVEASASLMKDPEDQPIGFRGILRDITPRKRMEKALRESEEKYRTILEEIEDGYYEVDLKGTVNFFNNAMCRILGYPSDELMGMNYRGFIDETNRRSAYKMFNEVYTTGKPHTGFEHEIRRKDGTKRFVECSVSLMKDAGGKPVGFRGVFRDTTERKRMEEMLREHEGRSRLLVENTTDTLFLHDFDGKIIDVNQHACNSLGYTREELLAMPIKDIEVNFDTDHHKEKWEQMVPGVPVTLKGIHRRKDGTTFPVEIRLVSFVESSERKHMLLGVVRDVTERKEAEEALEREKERFRLLVEETPLGISLAKKDGEFEYVNPGFTEMLGYRLEDVSNVQEWFKKAYPDEEYRNKIISSAAEDLKRFERGETRTESKVFNVRCKDGSEKAIKFIPVNMKAGGQFVIYEDVSEMKRLEEQLRQAQKMEAIGTLAGGIAHDFNNLLMAIQGNASLMLFSIHEEHPHYKMLKSIEDQVQSGAALTSKILGYARKGKYEVKTVNLNRLMEETSETFSRTRREIKIHRELAEDLSAVQADPAQIEQVLLNLYVNAADAMPGGGELFLRTRNVSYKDIKEKLYEAKLGKYVQLTVSDTGTGMDQETLSRIFDPFFTTKEVGRGTGLGLASAYGIIKNHNGYVYVDSEEGRGTTFSIYLPAAGVNGKGPDQGRERQYELMRGTGTILLIDDEEMVLEVGVRLLERLGYSVVVAKDGKEAIEVYRAKKDEVKLVILDMIMPEMGGGATYDRLKEVNPDVKVLLSSGYSIDGQAREIMERGCSGFIQKPFNTKELSQKIRQVLDEI